MNTHTINDLGLTELDNQSLTDIEGGRSIIGDIGYACGYAFGAATNAAEILGNAIKDVLISEGITRGLK